MAIKNGQRKNVILFLRFFYSLVPSQPALQLEVLLGAGECNRSSTAVWYPQFLDNGKATAQVPPALSGISSAVPAFWPISTYFLYLLLDDVKSLPT